MGGKSGPKVGLGTVLGGLGVVLEGSWCVLWGLGGFWGVSGMILRGLGWIWGTKREPKCVQNGRKNDEQMECVFHDVF